MSAPLPSSGSEPKVRVAICGAGIAGLILAITIGKYDPSVPIDLYEAHDSIDTVGVGIAVWRQTHEVLNELGLLDDFKQIFTQKPGTSHGPNLRRSDIREGGYNWFHVVHRYGLSSMHRQHMIAILEKHIPPSCTVHSGKRLVNYVEQEQQDAHSAAPIRLEFADGTTVATDVLIGADGVRSAVRKTMFETASRDDGDDKADLKQYGDATFTGITVYRCLVPAEALQQKNPENIALIDMTGYAGKGRYIVTYPIAQRALVNVVAYTYNPSLTGTDYEGRWVSDATSDELVGSFADFEPDVRTVLELCEKPSKWAMHVVKPLPFCVRKRVALIGDACHAMSPHFGAGAGQAIEDAFVLGRLIAHPLASFSRIPDALRIYEEVRLPFAQSVASISISTGWMYPFMAPGYYDGTRKEEDLDENGISAYERDGMETIRQEVFRRWNFLEEAGGAVEGWKDAEAKLQALAGQVAN